VAVNNYFSYPRCKLGLTGAGGFIEPVSECTNWLGQWRQWHVVGRRAYWCTAIVSFLDFLSCGCFPEAPIIYLLVV